MMDNYVTGGSGFIGKHLIYRLPHSVHIRHWELKTCRFDYVKSFFVLGTYGNMAHHANHRMMTKSNLEDLLYIIDYTNWENGWLCYMSSSSVTLQVQTPYSRTKRAAEEILQALPELKSCIVRPYSCTGIGEQKEHLIPTLIRSCMEGEEMPFDPYPVHDFIDVEDVVDALVEFAEHEHTGIFELGNGIPYTNQQVKEIVEEVTGKKANLKDSGRLRKYDSSAWYCQKPSIKGKKTLTQSIKEMVKEYAQNN